MGNNLPILIFTAAKLTKFSDKRISKVLKMHFLYRNNAICLYIRLFFA